MANPSVATLTSNGKWIYIFILILLGVMLAQSLLIVNNNETVQVYRLGKHNATLTTGFHLIYPYPIDRIERIPTFNGATLTSKTFRPGKAYEYVREMPPSLNPEDDTFLMSADGNAIFAPLSTLVWRVEPAQSMTFHAFYQQCKPNPTTLIQDQTPKCYPIMEKLLNRATIKVASMMKASEILGQPTLFNEAVQQETQRLFNTHQLGITIERMTIQTLVPPQVSANYLQATAATSEGTHRIVAAQTEADKIKNESVKSAEKIKSDAQIQSKQRIAEAQRDAMRFAHIQKQYAQNPESLTRYLRTQTLYTILQNAQERFVLDASTMQQLKVSLGRAPNPKKKKAESH